MDSLYHFNTRTPFNMKSVPIAFGVLAALSVPVAAVAAWITHVIACIKTASWILLAFGCIVAPVGVIHGVGVWFGFL